MKKVIASIILIPLSFLIVIGAIVSSPEEGSAQEVAAEKSQRKAVKEAKPEPTVKPVSAAKMNALSSAQVYLTTMPFSKEGLRNQLSFEGYNDSAAAYGVDNVVVDWNKQATRAAKNYLALMSFSKSGLVQQLVMGDHYTQSQAVKGANAAY
jgi:hypothetical protein